MQECGGVGGQAVGGGGERAGGGTAGWLAPLQGRCSRPRAAPTWRQFEPARLLLPLLLVLLVLLVLLLLLLLLLVVQRAHHRRLCRVHAQRAVLLVRLLRVLLRVVLLVLLLVRLPLGRVVLLRAAARRRRRVLGTRRGRHAVRCRCRRRCCGGRLGCRARLLHAGGAEEVLPLWRLAAARHRHVQRLALVRDLVRLACAGGGGAVRGRCGVCRGGRAVGGGSSQGRWSCGAWQARALQAWLLPRQAGRQGAAPHCAAHRPRRRCPRGRPGRARRRCCRSAPPGRAACPPLTAAAAARPPQLVPPSCRQRGRLRLRAGGVAAAAAACQRGAGGAGAGAARHLGRLRRQGAAAARPAAARQR